MSGTLLAGAKRGSYEIASPSSSRRAGRVIVAATMATVLAGKHAAESDKSAAIYAVTALLIAYVVVGGVMLASGPSSHPVLHTVLDTGVSLTAGILAVLLWVMGRHIGRPFLIWLAVGFGVTALLELIHLLVIVEWSGETT